MFYLTRGDAIVTKPSNPLSVRSAIPLGLLIAGPFYISLLLPDWYRPMMTLGGGARPGLLATGLSIHHSLMSFVAYYLGASALASLLLVIGVWRCRRTWWSWPYALVLAAILAVPVVYRYSPPLVPREGYDMRWPTRPALLAGVSRRSQTVWDAHCHHRILGWTADETLIYERGCSEVGQSSDVFAYNPEGNRLEKIEGVDERQLTSTPTSVRDWVLPSTYWDERLDYQSYTRAADYDSLYDWLLPEGAWASPDGRWAAARVRHPRNTADDVVLLRRAQ